jgi:DNA-binding NtrC family response regulator
MATARILVADDERPIRHSLKRLLTGNGHEVDAVADGVEACARLRDCAYDCVLTDLKMPGADGLDVLRLALEFDPATAVIVMTGYGSVGSAVEAMRVGAFYYLEKPFQIDDVEALVATALEHRRLRKENAFLQDELGTRLQRGQMVGDHEVMREVYDLVARVADSNATILITGESGTGKELVARAIHDASPRKGALLVPVNCVAIPEGLLESELFGHVKGAFTGAHRAREGRFSLADGGTIFLDEVGEMSPALQAKFLRVLQEREFEPVGGTRKVRVDVRVLAATNRELEAMVEEGTFREDLYYRLAVVPISLPPLRARKSDVGLLLDHFLARFAKRLGRKALQLDPEVIGLVEAYDWPGNVRELENLAERLVILARGDRVGPEDIPEKFRSPRGVSERSLLARGGHALPESGLRLRDFLARLEQDLIDQALARTGGNRNQAARLLGLNRTTLVEKLKKREPQSS